MQLWCLITLQNYKMFLNVANWLKKYLISTKARNDCQLWKKAIHLQSDRKAIICIDLAMKNTTIPLAERLRPASLDDYIGQKHIIGEHAVLRRAIESGRVP